MSADETPKHERLAQFLREQAQNGEFYCKSKFIAEEVEMSSKEIGVLMRQLEQSASDLEIEQWSTARATTWRVKA